MGALSRLMTVIKAKFSRLVGKAENPAELLDYSYEKQIELLQKVRKGLADVVTAKSRLKLQAGRLEEDVAKSDNQARRALEANREDLARLALQRKKTVQTQLQDIDTQIETILRDEEKLKETERQVQMRIEAFRTQKETMKAKYSAAEARVKTGEAISGLSSEFGDVGRALERAEEKTHELEARAMAVDELLDAGALPDLTAPKDQIEAELRRATAQSDIELELAELRKELGPGSDDGNEETS